MNIPKVGVGVFVVRNGKILLGKRKGTHGAGTWGLPGGHLEYGEEVEDCAFRELLEETGLQAIEFERGPWSNGMIEEKHYVTIFIIVRKSEGEPVVKEPQKCEEWKWFDLNRLPTPLFAPAEQFLLALKQATLGIDSELLLPEERDL